ncbi:glutathionylspermidine synthase family protein [Vibrio parahaemolyticus]|nr:MULTISPECIES: glutathionylspermidine synthase family protein [unclassified Vibrio]MDF5108716.1 glutathionylspermidine synthase family protein [Vibrio parahaemolyticus]MDF5143621.1 glutathionylspermidine synthase family protein [Vibrio parahaemolyticus]MDF5154047.1 glutathionylspermidine synthase family protein [Vibrio parahaemolyticus]MDW1568430.1 glutathionylspermidine synthase family protein [Vibrio sp. YT-15]MDW1929385.1 glutathionylspermidine synthase family protein [Vibrio sp. 947]
MLQIPTQPRHDWKKTAQEFNFGFHTFDDEPYWTEDRYFQFTLTQIERDIEQPTEEIHQMSLNAIAKVIESDELMAKFQIPESMWGLVRESWKRRDPSLYSRIDLAYDGKNPAKLLELNSDTPTSLYELAFFSWLWLEEKVNRGELPQNADQFNLLEDLLVRRFIELKPTLAFNTMHFACCKDTIEDRGTVQYLQDCAKEAGIHSEFVYVEDIGISEDGKYFTDANSKPIDTLFKLYPWEYMLREEYSQHLETAEINWMEPLWKSISSNKAILPLLWEMYPGHPNLLEAYFENDPRVASMDHYVVKPIFSREGANISIVKDGEVVEFVDGPYGSEGKIVQAYTPLPTFGENHVLIGSWLVNGTAAGIGIREDEGKITKDSSRFIPHIILG